MRNPWTQTVAAWIEVQSETETEEGLMVEGTGYVAGQPAIDRMAEEREVAFKTATLLRRKEEFTARAVYEWNMKEE